MVVWSVAFDVSGLVGARSEDSSLLTSLSLLLCGGSLTDLVVLGEVGVASERRWVVRAALRELQRDLVREPLAALRDVCFLETMLLMLVALRSLGSCLEGLDDKSEQSCDRATGTLIYVQLLAGDARSFKVFA